MTESQIQLLDDKALFKLSLERGGKHNCYTSDALKAQAEYCRRKGNEIKSHNSNAPVKRDNSYYANRYY